MKHESLVGGLKAACFDGEGDNLGHRWEKSFRARLRCWETGRKAK